MKLTKLIFCAMTLALGVATAASGYKVSIPEKMWVGSTELKAGDYKVEVTGNQATFKMGKEAIQVPASLETNNTKYSTTEIDASESKLQEIHVGGTTAKIVFNGAAAKSVPAQ
jgi:hypothetical protein